MNTDFTLRELETLADAWFECRLDDEEEKALRTLLAASQLHSPALDQCRMAMGLELTAARSRAARHSRPVRRIWLSAAASVALLAGLGFAALTLMQPSADLIEVYIDGRRVDDPERARAIAEAQLRQSQNEVACTMQAAANVIADAEQSEEFINETIESIKQ